MCQTLQDAVLGSSHELSVCEQGASGRTGKPYGRIRRGAKRRDTGIAATMSLDTLQEGGYFDMTMQACPACCWQRRIAPSSLPLGLAQLMSGCLHATQ